MRALADRERIRRLMQALGRAARDEAMGRFALTPEKFEMWQGRLFWSEADRLVLLGLLLENVGADAAVRLGIPEILRAAVRHLV